ncbi:MAG: DNA-J related domain-containing protein [Spirochaetales bacterium]
MNHGDGRSAEIPVDVEGLFSYLEPSREKISEADLMQRFVGSCEGSDETMGLFLRHFELYHCLYTLETDFAERGLALEIGLANVRVHEIPPDDECHYFDEGYCRRPVTSGRYCSIHSDLSERRSGCVGRVSMRGYYLDRTNMQCMDPERLSGMMNGIYEYASNQEQIDAACALLGVSRGCSVGRLRARFRYLSKHHHPDTGGDEAYFKRLQDAYERLIRLHSLAKR